jgi:hypothetical protein
MQLGMPAAPAGGQHTHAKDEPTQLTLKQTTASQATDVLKK